MPETLSGDAQRDIIYTSFNRVLNGDEINLEGLAYYKGTYNEYLFFGMRTPVFENKTSVWRLNFKDIKEGKVQTPTLWFTFNANTGNGEKESISSIEYYPELSALFILTTYESKNGIGGALWIGRAENPEDYTIDLPKYPVYQWKDIKPEGLTLIKDKDGKNIIYIVFDNDEKETGIPGMYTLIPVDKVCPFFK